MSFCFSVFRMLQRRKNSKYRIKGDNPSFDSGYVKEFIDQ